MKDSVVCCWYQVTYILLQSVSHDIYVGCLDTATSRAMKRSKVMSFVSVNRHVSKRPEELCNLPQHLKPYIEAKSKQGPSVYFRLWQYLDTYMYMFSVRVQYTNHLVRQAHRLKHSWSTTQKIVRHEEFSPVCSDNDFRVIGTVAFPTVWGGQGGV